MSVTGSRFPAAPGAARDSQAPLAALSEGRLFGGRYRIVRHIATGGMGSVFEVVHVETERRRALKVMHAHLFQSDEMRERFQREARIAAQVESEHIVDVSDAGVDEATGTPFLVMELLHGEELGRRLERTGPMSPPEVMVCLQQVGLALDRTHSRMIVHRDLKPENLFLTYREDGSPRIKILDFGVAKLVAESATGAGATRSLGTPLYMAPEQFRTGSRILPAADIHALGMMAFTLLVGEPYWTPEACAAGDVIAFAMTAVQGPKESAVRRAAARRVALPAAFDGWFARATAVNPADRFRSASEAVRALGEALGVSPGTDALVVNPGTGTLVMPGLRAGAGAGGAGRPAGHSGPVGESGRLAVDGGQLAGGGGRPAGLQGASTSTGAAVGLVSDRRPRSRAPVIGAAGAGVAGILAVLLWMTMGRTAPTSGDAPADSDVPSRAAGSRGAATPGAEPVASTGAAGAEPVASTGTAPEPDAGPGAAGTGPGAAGTGPGAASTAMGAAPTTTGTMSAKDPETAPTPPPKPAAAQGAKGSAAKPPATPSKPPGAPAPKATSKQATPPPAAPTPLIGRD